MIALENGMLVQHATLGVGKVVALEPTAAHVFFPGAPGTEQRFAAKLRLPFALALLSTEGVVHDARLDGLPGFALDPKSGRFAPTAAAAEKRARAKPRRKS